MVSFTKKILLVLISLIVGIVNYAQGAENRNENPSFHDSMTTRPLLKKMLYGNCDRYGGPKYDEDAPKEISQIDIIPQLLSDRRFQEDRFFEIHPAPEDIYRVYRENFLSKPARFIDSQPKNNPKHLVLSIEFDKSDALNYLLHRYPQLIQSPEKILESLAFAIENDYKKAFSVIFNDFVKDKPLFMDSPKLVIKLFILSAQMGNQEAFDYLKNRIEKLNLTPDARKFIYLKVYDALSSSNPELAQQFLAEDIAAQG